MKVLACHNHYRFPGGEDQVFADEARLLEARGCEVVRYVRHSKDTERMSSLETLRRTFWNPQTYHDLRQLIRGEAPDVVHCTNTFPIISPAAYDAARDEGVPVVQSLHNFRAICPNGLFLRGGRPCEDCLGKSLAWPGVVHRCYRNSHLASAAMAGLISRQRRRRETGDPVAVYIALSEFSRERFLAAGFPPDRVVVKPNFVDPDPGPGDGSGAFSVFVGRLSEEKGLDVMLDAWSRAADLPALKVIGNGPLAQQVMRAEARDQRIQWLGHLPVEQVYELIGRATCLILPSRCYENCPKAILEAYSRGTPVVAPRLGAMEEYVKDGETGLQFQPGNPDDLAIKVQTLLSDREPYRMIRFGARQEYEQRYTADVNFETLMRVYAHATGRHAEELVPRPTERVPRVGLSPLPSPEGVGFSQQVGSSSESALS
jgi:glycosyltransferase involved in cell wall biosynthesis